MKQAWHRPFAGMWTDSHSAARLGSIWISLLISRDSRLSWRQRFFGLCRSALQIFTDIQEVRLQRFDFAISTAKFLSRWRTKVRAYRQRSRRQWSRVARPASELGE